MQLKLNNNKTYAEVGQVNPLRWKTLYRESPTEFVDQSGWIKCKDFYNDTVAYFKSGVIFSIWSYDNAVKKNDEGVYFLLKYIKDKASFLRNLEIVNKQLFKDLNCTVGHLPVDENDSLIILIPNQLWESTYRISLITLCVRLCNYGYDHKSWEEFWHSQSPGIAIDKVVSADAVQNILKYGFHVPQKFSKYWWFAGLNHNSEKLPKQTGAMIHNNGINDWSMWMKKAEQ